MPINMWQNKLLFHHQKSLFKQLLQSLISCFFVGFFFFSSFNGICWSQEIHISTGSTGLPCDLTIILFAPSPAVLAAAAAQSRWRPPTVPWIGAVAPAASGTVPISSASSQDRPSTTTSTGTCPRRASATSSRHTMPPAWPPPMCNHSQRCSLRDGWKKEREVWVTPWCWHVSSSVINKDQVVDPWAQSWPLIKILAAASTRTESHVPEVPLKSHWVAALWQVFSIHTFIFFIFYIEYSYFYVYKFWRIWGEIKRKKSSCSSLRLPESCRCRGQIHVRGFKSTVNMEQQVPLMVHIMV